MFYFHDSKLGQQFGINATDYICNILTDCYLDTEQNLDRKDTLQTLRDYYCDARESLDFSSTQRAVILKELEALGKWLNSSSTPTIRLVQSY